MRRLSGPYLLQPLLDFFKNRMRFEKLQSGVSAGGNCSDQRPGTRGKKNNRQNNYAERKLGF